MAYLLLLFVAGRCLVPMDETDLFFNLRLGEVVLETGRVPTENLLSFTNPAATDVNLAWLFQLLLVLAYRVGGIAGTVVLKTGFVLAAWGVLHRVAVRRGAEPAVAALVLALAAWAAEPRFVERPHLVTFVGLALVLLALERAEAGRPRLLWLMAPLGLAWANGNSCFFLAPSLLALYAAGARAEGLRTEARRALLVALAMVPLAFATPAGAGWLSYVANHWRMPELRPLQEYRTASWPLDGPFFFLVASLAAAVAVPLVRRTGRLVPLRVLVPLVALGLLGSRRIRFVAEFAMLAGPALAVAATRFGSALATTRFGPAALAVAATRFGPAVAVAATRFGSTWRFPREAGTRVAPTTDAESAGGTGAKCAPTVDAEEAGGGGAGARDSTGPARGAYLPQAARRGTRALRVTAGLALLALAVVPRAIDAAAGGRWLDLGIERGLVPVAAVEFVERHGLRERMYNDLEVGSYLTWRGWPRWRVFQDPRINGYPDDFHAVLRRVDLTGVEWRRLLDGFGVDAALITYPDVNPRGALFDPGLWALVYRATDGLVFTRRLPGRAALIDEFELPVGFSYSAAGGLVAKALAARPADSPVPECEWQRRVGEFARAEGDPRSAQRAFQAALGAEVTGRCTRENWRPSVRRALGGLALRLGEPARALAVLDGLADTEATVNRGYARLALGTPARALEDFERVLACTPGHDEAGVGRALALVALGRRAEAVAVLRAVLTRSPGQLAAAAAAAELRKLEGNTRVP